jgi:hypothetical protein
MNPELETDCEPLFRRKVRTWPGPLVGELFSTAPVPFLAPADDTPVSRFHRLSQSLPCRNAHSTNPSGSEALALFTGTDETAVKSARNTVVMVMQRMADSFTFSDCSSTVKRRI